MFKPLKSLLGKALERRPLQEGVRGAVLIDHAKEVMEEVFPKWIIPQMQPTAFRNGIITITVRGPGVAQEVRTRGAIFLKALNEKIGNSAVTHIRIRIAPADKNPK